MPAPESKRRSGLQVYVNGKHVGSLSSLKVSEPSPDRPELYEIRPQLPPTLVFEEVKLSWFRRQWKKVKRLIRTLWKKVKRLAHEALALIRE